MQNSEFIFCLGPHFQGYIIALPRRHPSLHARAKEEEVLKALPVVKVVKISPFSYVTYEVSRILCKYITRPHDDACGAQNALSCATYL